MTLRRKPLPKVPTKPEDKQELRKVKCPWCDGRGGRGEDWCVMCNASGEIYYKPGRDL